MKCPECGSKNVSELPPWSSSESRTMFKDYQCEDCGWIWHKSPSALKEVYKE